jgi:hypothetical protein
MPFPVPSFPSGLEKLCDLAVGVTHAGDAVGDGARAALLAGVVLVRVVLVGELLPVRALSVASWSLVFTRTWLALSRSGWVRRLAPG